MFFAVIMIIVFFFLQFRLASKPHFLSWCALLRQSLTYLNTAECTAFQILCGNQGHAWFRDKLLWCISLGKMPSSLLFFCPKCNYCNFVQVSLRWHREWRCIQVLQVDQCPHSLGCSVFVTLQTNSMLQITEMILCVDTQSLQYLHKSRSLQHSLTQEHCCVIYVMNVPSSLSVLHNKTHSVI